MLLRPDVKIPAFPKVILSFILLFLFVSASLAQNRINISKPDLSYANNNLTVNYDITGCGSGQYVDIKMIVLNSAGDTIMPSYISGDIGSMVNCGFGKTITWNLVRDSVKIDDDIEIMIVGKEYKPVIPSIITAQSRGITRGKVIGSSVFVPGLGQKMASGKSGHLVFTALFYGSAGACGYFYMKHKNYYADYQNASGPEADEFFDKSERSYNMSKYMLFGAAGVWVTNFIWSAVIPIKERPLKNASINIIPGLNNDLFISARWNF